MATSVTQPDEAIQTAKRPRVPNKLLFVVSVLVGVSLLFLLIVRMLAAHTAAQEAGTLNLVGHPAPDLTISAWNVSPEQQMRLSTLIHGRIAVVNFWASWCDPCQQEAPDLATSSQAYEPLGVSFVGVAVQTSKANGIAFLQKFDMPYPAGGADTSQVNARYELGAIPETVIVDQHGIVRQVFRGPISAQELSVVLNKLLHQ
jgi:thiol-disulfide isomerase/thioredoxin